MEMLELGVGIIIGIFVSAMIPKMPIGLNELIRKHQGKKNENSQYN